MKSKERTKMETTYAHAAQIFCEMLGQVCHEKFYENRHTEYQEVVFPLLINIDDRHLLSMQDMQPATSSMPGFRTFISRISSNLEPSIPQIRRTLSASCFNHLVSILCVTPLNRRLSSPSLRNCLITWSAGTAISGICAITRE